MNREWRRDARHDAGVRPDCDADVFAEILERRMSLRDLKPVFPGYMLEEKKRLGVIA